MLSADLVIATGVAYVGLLFLIAYVSRPAGAADAVVVPDLALRLHARHLGLLHELDLLRRGRLGRSQRP